MNKDINDFLEFAHDHYEHFGVWPLEFETSNGEVWTHDKCWDVLKNQGFV